MLSISWLASRVSDDDSELAKLDRLSTMLDSRYRIPGKPIRFGLDSLLGLIPGVGDLASLGPSAYLICRAHQMGASKRTIGRMAANTGLDFFIGAVPLPCSGPCVQRFSSIGPVIRTAVFHEPTGCKQ